MVSICIPVFNGERYIRKTLLSTLDQTHSDIEILVIDNASTDRTLEIVKNFEDHRIKIIENPSNCGMVANWNKCLDAAVGEYMQILCADDLLEPASIERKFEKMEMDKNIVLVFSASCIIDENDNVLMKRRRYKHDRIFEGIRFARKSFRSRNLFGEPSSVMFRRTASMRIGYFNDTLCYSPDWEYWLRLSLLGRVCYIDESLYRFRISVHSETNNLFRKKSRITEDDRHLVRCISDNVDFKLSPTDIFIHQAAVSLRSSMKSVYLRFQGRKRKSG